MALLFFKLILIILISIVTTPVVCDLLIMYYGNLPWPFARVFDRVILGVLLLFFVLAFFKNPSCLKLKNHKLSIEFKSALKFLLFFSLSAGSTLAVLPWIVDNSELIYEVRTANYLLSRMPKIIIAATLIAILEENLFRKFLFDQIKLKWGLLISYIGTSLIYAIVHFLKPDKSFEYNQSWLDGFNYIYALLSRSVDLSSLKAAFALFLVGMILSYVRSRTNTILYCIALHIGWIFSIKFARYTSILPATQSYPAGSGREYYLLTFYEAWLAILFVALFAYLILPKRFIGDQSSGVA